jgi:hypothetical protein
MQVRKSRGIEKGGKGGIKRKGDEEIERVRWRR